MISPPVSRRAHAWHDAHIRICGEHVGRGRGDRSGQEGYCLGLCFRVFR